MKNNNDYTHYPCMFQKLTLTFGILLLLSSKALAQFYTGTDLSYMTLQHSTYMSSVNLINANSQYFAEQHRHEVNKRNSSNGSDGRTTARTAAHPKTFQFTSNNQISERVKQSIIDNIKKKNPNSKLDEALSDKNNPYPKYVKLLKSLGLDVQHDYADAFTAYMLGMWRIANKMNENPSKQQIQYVRDQVIAITDVSKWTNAQKQEATEYLIYNLIFANEPYEGSRLSRNQKQLQEDSDAVQQRFLRENNLNLRNMTITKNGLTRKN